MNRTVYCISGLGADEGVFANLRLKGYTLKHIPWFKPGKKETIETYAERMAAYIKEEDAVLLGVSFGGMMAIEVARHKKLRKVVLVSSIKSAEEMPRWMKIAGKLKLNKMLPVRTLKFTEKLDNRRLGATTKEEKALARSYRQSVDTAYLEWAIDEILNWKNDWIPGNVIHVHGEKDKIFPATKISAAYIIKDATHMMVYNRGDEVSSYISKELEK